MTDHDYETEEPLAVFESALLPDWTWEAYEVEERDAEVVTDVDDGEVVTTTTDIYHGRVKSPKTRGSWEYGSFSVHELEKAGAFRTDEETDAWP